MGFEVFTAVKMSVIGGLLDCDTVWTFVGTHQQVHMASQPKRPPSTLRFLGKNFSTQKNTFEIPAVM
jgi:hypothetical protein